MTPAEEQALAVVAQAFCAAHGLRFAGGAGHGAFKANYRVEHPSGTAALKVYLPGAVTDRAVRELESLQELAKLKHPSLPAFLAVKWFDHAGARYLVSAEEFLGGGCLAARLQNGALLTSQAVKDLGSQLAGALSAFHPLRLVHRDIKPDNVMFRSDGTTAVLVDFGLVRDLSKQSLTKTWIAQGPGTPFFAPPEQLNNQKPLIDWRADQFALGVTLAICATGRHPFARQGDTADAVVARVACRERPSPEFVNWAAQPGNAPVAKMVEPWPVSRYRIPNDLVAAWANP